MHSCAILAQGNNPWASRLIWYFSFRYFSFRVWSLHVYVCIICCSYGRVVGLSPCFRSTFLVSGATSLQSTYTFASDAAANASTIAHLPQRRLVHDEDPERENSESGFAAGDRVQILDGPARGQLQRVAWKLRRKGLRIREHTWWLNEFVDFSYRFNGFLCMSMTQ